MAERGFTRRPTGEREIQPCAIASVDPVKRKAMVLTRVKTMIEVDVAYSTGDTTVTPAVGEQWYIERFDAVWRLYGRIPFNDPTLATEAVEGQVSVGSGRGPVELHGPQINARGTLNLLAVATADRPNAANYPPGATIYDTTLKKALHSDGLVWRDAMGTAV